MGDLDLSEVGGGRDLRRFWCHYIDRNVDLVAFFVDASTPPRFEEAATELTALCGVVRERARHERVALIVTRAANAAAATQAYQALQSRCGGVFQRAELAELRQP